MEGVLGQQNSYLTLIIGASAHAFHAPQLYNVMQLAVMIVYAVDNMPRC